MTVRQNLSYGLRMSGRPKAEVEQRTNAMAEFLRLTPLLDRRADRLSVNILQRVAIGRSAVMEPAIFLLDEPLSNVDAAFRAVMRTELKSLQRQFRQTMVYVTHDQLEAMTMADRIAVMDHGVLQQVGRPIDVYNDPANTFVATFIGAPGMNLLKGRPVRTDRGMAVDLGPFGVTPLLAPPQAKAAEAATGEVVYGFRPEQTALGEAGLPAFVTFVERIGARIIVHLGEGEGAFKAVFEKGVPLSVGEVARVTPHPEAVRLFDGANGAALGRG
jgi:multiple sugar transport system ATP-binding protein